MGGGSTEWNSLKYQVYLLFYLHLYILSYDGKRTVLTHANIFLSQKQAALQASAFREASYRFSDSLCILNPACEYKKKKKMEKAATGEQEGQDETRLVLFHSPLVPEHWNQHQFRGKSDEDNALAVHPCPHAAQQAARPRDGLFASLEQHHTKLRPMGTRSAGRGQPPPPGQIKPTQHRSSS